MPLGPPAPLDSPAPLGFLGPQDHLFVLTGAGISVESGLLAFRGNGVGVPGGLSLTAGVNGGLWNGYRVDEVATPEAWVANPALVWDFYSNRRHDACDAQPNAAHLALAQLEQHLGDRFYLVTQNVDDLHEKAGSHRVHHMHGTLSLSRCVRCDAPFPDAALHLDPAHLPTCQDCGAAVRPHIVWFGEMPLDLDGIFAALDQATVVLVVGTSGTVYPAAAFVQIAHRRGLRTVYIGPEEPLNADSFTDIRLGTATDALPRLATEWLGLPLPQPKPSSPAPSPVSS